MEAIHILLFLAIKDYYCTLQATASHFMLNICICLNATRALIQLDPEFSLYIT